MAIDVSVIVGGGSAPNHNRMTSLYGVAPNGRPPTPGEGDEESKGYPRSGPPDESPISDHIQWMTPVHSLIRYQSIKLEYFTPAVPAAAAGGGDQAGDEGRGLNPLRFGDPGAKTGLYDQNSSARTITANIKILQDAKSVGKINGQSLVNSFNPNMEIFTWAGGDIKNSAVSKAIENDINRDESRKEYATIKSLSDQVNVDGGIPSYLKSAFAS